MSVIYTVTDFFVKKISFDAGSLHRHCGRSVAKTRNLLIINCLVLE